MNKITTGLVLSLAVNSSGLAVKSNIDVSLIAPVNPKWLKQMFAQLESDDMTTQAEMAPDETAQEVIESTEI